MKKMFLELLVAASMIFLPSFTSADVISDLDHAMENVGNKIISNVTIRIHKSFELEVDGSTYQVVTEELRQLGGDVLRMIYVIEIMADGAQRPLSLEENEKIFTALLNRLPKPKK